MPTATIKLTSQGLTIKPRSAKHILAVALVMVLVSSFLLAGIFVGTAHAQNAKNGASTKTWIVSSSGNANFTTIQAALNHANGGDIILVEAGTYNESVQVNKQVVIDAVSGAEETLVNAEAGHVFTVTANNVTINGFTVKTQDFSGSYGIELSRAEFCTISNLICSNASIGIHLLQANKNQIKNNDVSGNGIGIYLHQSNNNIIANNVASNSSYSSGITLAFSSNNQIIDNIVNFNVDEGIQLIEQPTTNNVIANNTINSNKNYGIHLFAAQNNQITSNLIADNGKAVWLRGASKNNKITANQISNNNYGIFLGDPNNLLGDCAGNQIYHNNLVNNAIQAYVYRSSSVWDNGYGFGGNYWSNYNGSDANQDGIGDIPYVIDVDNSDCYPLMQPFGTQQCDTPPVSSQTTWTVDDDGPADFRTIQAAINSASDGDRVIVHQGTYQEHVVLNKTLTLQSNEKAIIDASEDGDANISPIIARWSGVTVLADCSSVSGFTVKGAANRGIEIKANNCTISDNTCEQCHVSGIALYGDNEGYADLTDCTPKNNILSDNTVENCQTGIWVCKSYNNIIQRNTLTANEYAGIYLFRDSHDNQILQNAVSKSTHCWDGSGGYGIAIGTGAHNNLCIENSITRNSNTGVFIDLLGIGYTNPYANKLYHNKFIDNTFQAYDSGTNNIWDNGYPSGGNYWSSVKLVDANHDGIGDTPYCFEENSSDRYPLMQPCPSNTELQLSIKVSGYILDDSGHGIGGAKITFNQPDVVSVSSDYLGHYTIYAPTGNYHIEVYPPWDSNYIQYDLGQYVVGQTDVTKNITLLTGCKVSGYIVDYHGTPVQGTTISLNGFTSGWSSNYMGYYSVAAPAGTYRLNVVPQSNSGIPSYFEEDFAVYGDTVKNVSLRNPTTNTATPTTVSNVAVTPVESSSPQTTDSPENLTAPIQLTHQEPNHTETKAKQDHMYGAPAGLLTCIAATGVFLMKRRQK